MKIIQFTFEDEATPFALEIDESINIEEVLNNLKKELNELLETDNFDYACDLDFYEDRLSKIQGIKVLDIDEVIYFNY